METNLPKLIYITGLAYSGTTLFSSALGRSENVFNAGEVNYLENDYNRDKVCSCGQKVDNCNAWKPVLDTLKNQQNKHVKTLNFTDAQTLRTIDSRSPSLRTRILTFFGARPEVIFGEKEIIDYAIRHQHFIRVLAGTVKVDYVVDASKSLARLHALYYYTDLNMHVVYVRRSLIQSYASRLKRAKRRNKLYVPLFAPVYLCVIYFRDKNLNRQLKAFESKDVSIVDYEAFVEDQRSTEAQLSEELGISVDFGINENEFNLDHLHVFTGNIWLSQAAKTKSKVTVKSSDGQGTLTWLEKQSFRILVPLFKLFSD